MVEFDVSMFAFVREGIRYTRHKTSLCPAAVTGIYRHNPGHKKGGYENGWKKPSKIIPQNGGYCFFHGFTPLQVDAAASWQ
jgi:hypothetical protein